MRNLPALKGTAAVATCSTGMLPGRFRAGRVLTGLFLASFFLGANGGCDAPPQNAADNQESPTGDSGGGALTSTPGDRSTEPEMVKVPAEVGVAKQGQKTQQHADAGGVRQMIAQPAASLFATKQRVVFEIQIPQAMELYKATNGNYPKSHDEFMKEIIQFNKIKLPELPDGQSYEYDAQSSKLMVLKPADR